MAKKQSKSGVDKTGCRRAINIIAQLAPGFVNVFPLCFTGRIFWPSAIILTRPAAEHASQDPPQAQLQGPRGHEISVFEVRSVGNQS